MVNVSKEILEQTELDALFGQLNGTIGQLGAKKSELFLSSFLGAEEKIMLAKRLAAIIMLTHGQSLYLVASALKISTSTAKNYKLSIQEGRYDLLLEAIAKRKARYIELIETIDSILHLGGVLPHYGQTQASEAYQKDREKRSKNLSVNRKV
ncbi:hypothetical protein A2592_02505 [Candidatus Kaiserbacteria bacterium RIFOXYD1_FULL_42_15]|uniref:Uncharacterized protein n=1 Tax=Candidatus Kaiserbacteria bacterium RIFOXYD1_FULL_42_15 TaxID=1798532 RepID=A0A1F6FPQ4_9BACT|nr:MAG: hypothetical protein A2592_02505 [Candidatus Kaiserbacteria bacterium RIFOXYD1_FULL_42_15]